MMRRASILVLAFAATCVGAARGAVITDFHGFYIRNHDGTIAAPWDSDMSVTENPAEDGFAASTPRGGQKVGYGTNAFDGLPINQIGSVDFTKVSGKDAIVPYLNMWVTDGTNYAVISSENDYRGTDFSTRQEWKVFEYDPAVGFDWYFDSGTGGRSGQYLTRDGVNVTLADFSDSITLVDPGDPYPSYVGTGAPRGGYGFNIIFGDTQSNYVGDYHIEELTVAAGGEDYHAGSLVPEPATAVLLGLGGLGLLGLESVTRRRGRARRQNCPGADNGTSARSLARLDRDAIR